MGPPFVIVSTCKGGGYTYARTQPPHPRRNSKGLYPRHRVIAENEIGRLLEADEVVHHLDGDKTNDSPRNLEVLSRAEHSRQHGTGQRVFLCCPECGDWFTLTPGAYRLRLKRSTSERLACSRSCGTRQARR